MSWKFNRSDTLESGDRVWTDDGEMVISSVTPGIIPGHLSINWFGGFGEVRKCAKVESLKKTD